MDSGSWILRNILKLRDEVEHMEQWQNLIMEGKFKMKNFYGAFLKQIQQVEWRGLLVSNYTRPRAVFTLWLACHKRLATKERLEKFGVHTDQKCEFCECSENIQHLFFECRYTKEVWSKVLHWLNVKHQAKGWDQELAWLGKVCRSKNWRSSSVKAAIAETVYALWMQRNDKVFQKDYRDTHIVQRIIDTIVNRIWVYPKYREKIARMIVV
ncbi:uncharacterized protein LOC131626585 [Vicia villosa]|uniref:uncharacterized protein LOC131626585 n=1 Tax=Vicia villosa TaxID=3911 RepID=UPI00273BFD8C|nr:uncharacterized protein LOC131626585 [Vicia villosa]